MNLILSLVRRILLDVSSEPTTPRKNNYKAQPKGKRRADVLLMQVRQLYQ
jgi:hypothetical protein